MKSLLLFVFIQVAVISARAGLVTLTEGRVNVAVSEHVDEGKDLRTGVQSRAELLLNPDTYLRIGGETIVTLESAMLEAVTIRLVQGRAVIHSLGLSPTLPIKLRIGETDLSIVSDGLYFFDEERVMVINGGIALEGSNRKIEKGRTLFLADGSIERAALGDPDALELLRWSQRRSRRLYESAALTSKKPARRGFPITLFAQAMRQKILVPAY